MSGVWHTLPWRFKLLFKGEQLNCSWGKEHQHHSYTEKLHPLQTKLGSTATHSYFLCVVLKIKMFLTDKSKQKDHSYQICLHTFQVQLHWLSCRSLNSPIRLNIMQIFHVDTACSGSQMCKILGPDSTHCSPLCGSKTHRDCHIYLKEHIQFLATQDRKSHVPIVEHRKGCWKGMRHLQPLYPSVFACSATAF